LPEFSANPNGSCANGLDYAWSTRPERLLPIYRSYSDLPVVSISNDQRRPLPEMNWIRTVYHGLPRDLLKLVLEPPYLAFSEGFPRRSVPISPLRSRDVQACHSRSPRRLVMIEALAWGAPVIARLCGSVPEILRHGITGLIGSSLDELVAAVGKIGELSRQTCRQEFEARFTAEVMAANYEDVYYQLADSDWSLRRHQSTARSKRRLGDAVLARYAAHQWHPAVSRDQSKSGFKRHGAVRPLFSKAYDDRKIR
jgi:hypothetical protein